MTKKHKSHHRAALTPGTSEFEVAIVEEITTCDCSHTLDQHGTRGCSVIDCECDRERGVLLVGKMRAIDEL